jgi:hypothetical protein
MCTCFVLFDQVVWGYCVVCTKWRFSKHKEKKFMQNEFLDLAKDQLSLSHVGVEFLNLLSVLK